MLREPTGVLNQKNERATNLIAIPSIDARARPRQLEEPHLLDHPSAGKHGCTPTRSTHLRRLRPQQKQ